MSPKRVPNRYCLLCPVCNTSKECLSVHLKSSCMKTATEEARVQVLKKAKEEADLLLRVGRVYTYELIEDIMGSSDPLKRMIEELERRNNVVVGVPSAESASEPTAAAAQLPDTQAGPSAIVAKSARIVRGDMSTTPHDVTAVLRAARADFSAVLAKISDSSPMHHCQLETAECLLLLYYLEAVVVLKHLQSPCVVEHMTVEAWKNRTKQDKGYVAIAVKEHKTGAVFLLSPEEEDWFHVYFEYVRDQLKFTKRLRASPDTEKVEEDPEDRFFLSTTGKPITNCSKDLDRLHKKYNVAPVSSQVAKQAFETAAEKLTDADKALVANYMSHSKAGGDLLRALDLIDTMSADTSRESERASPPSSSHHKYRSPQMVFQAEWDAFSKGHPVTVAGRAPGPVDRLVTPREGQRRLYKRWRKEQKKLRIQHIVAQFPRRLPTEGRVAKCIADQGWQRNCPSPASVLEAWQPTGDLLLIPTSKAIRRMVSSQKWNGLAIQDTSDKGRAVFATRPFQAGEVVCDYHGSWVSNAEGLKTHASTRPEETGYMFFVKNSSGVPMCIDAHMERCACHPDRQTFGRLINHSCKRANIKPRLFTLTFESGERDVLLMMAVRGIKVGEELLYDYGVKRRQFRGEGLDLEWLD